VYLNERGFGRKSNESGFEVPFDQRRLESALIHSRAIHEREGGGRKGAASAYGYLIPISLGRWVADYPRPMRFCRLLVLEPQHAKFQDIK
jgi:hypothetical protein